MLKHSVKLRRDLLCGCVAACHRMACVLHAQHATQTPFHFIHKCTETNINN